MAEQFSADLEKFKLVCYFCGVPVDEKVVNKNCHENKKQYSPSFVGFTEKQPKVKYFGKKKHFFALPLDLNTLSRMKQSKQVEVPINVLQQVKTISFKKNIDIEELLNEQANREGYITSVKFCGVLIHNLSMKLDDLDIIINWLDPSNIGKVSVKYFKKILNELPIEEEVAEDDLINTAQEEQIVAALEVQESKQ